MRKTESWRSAKARLLCELDRLRVYCQPVENQKAKDENAEEPWWERHVQWPGREFLWDIERNVLVLASYERARQIVPKWKAFKIVDKRVPALRLVQRVGPSLSRSVGARQRAASPSLVKRQREGPVEGGSLKTHALLRVGRLELAQ